MPGPLGTSGHAALEFDHVSFAYPGADEPVLRDATARIPVSSFVALTGDTGSGKTTLLRLAKREIRPAGYLGGVVRVQGADVGEMDERTSAGSVGYVFQRPENQIVCDAVWHEMAFGLENLATPRGEMRRRIAETCSYLGMEPWFRSTVDELSGGQRQVLALASVLVMRPGVLLLDEPASMLDPVAERRLLALLFQLNRELGMTVVVATHAPDRLRPYATMRLHLAGGRIEAQDMAGGTVGVADAPVPGRPPTAGGRRVIETSDVWLRYARDADWVLRGMSLAVAQGEAHALIGNNGSGKSTVLSLVAGVLRAQRGRVRNAARGSQALLPQDPKMLLACETVREELLEWVAPADGDEALAHALDTLGLSGRLLDRHPYDLSGGEQQLVALGKLLATRPRLLLLDEPTKGLDTPSRRAVARVVERVRDGGTTVVVATHDLGFVREVSDTVSLLFDGQVATTEPVGTYVSTTWLHGPSGTSGHRGGGMT